MIVCLTKYYVVMNFDIGACKIIREDCCCLDSTQFASKVNEVAKVIQDEVTNNNYNPVHYYLLCISMSGQSQQYGCLLIYSLLKNNILDQKFIDNELKYDQPEWVKILLNSNNLTEQIGVKSIDKTQYGLQIIERDPYMGGNMLYVGKKYWESQFELIN